ncbi:transcriptional regulator [Streptomyces sp. SA15]|uniref:XRE family transcriptional regulator n=1 Tax=Streptomyces sp. SA15 TaxID=934019 RepID=UPI000BAFEF37|nr:XRE family transcriptional regulator [Streptomyces sp. SA15]PAZ13452.1 transcriptional regulator [Streptomyces sp. SA15]
MSTVPWEEVKRRAHERQRAAGIPVMTPEEKQAAKEQLLAEVRAYKLAEIRREQELTQRDIADSMGVSTPRISAIEHGEIDRTEVATLRAYVRALGGELRVVADFGDAAYTVA